MTLTEYRRAEEAEAEKAIRHEVAECASAERGMATVETPCPFTPTGEKLHRLHTPGTPAWAILSDVIDGESIAVRIG